MQKIREKLITILGNQKSNFKNYFMSFSIIIITTLLMVILDFEDEIFLKIYVGLILYFILTFCIETVIKKIHYRIISYIIAIFISVISVHYIFQGNNNIYTNAFIIGIYLFTLTITLYKIIENNKDNLSNYLIQIFQNNIFLGIVSSVLQLGIIYIIVVIYELLIGNTNTDLYLKAELLLLGLIIIPLFILSILNTKQKITKFIEILIYIMLFIIGISYLVIYLYFIKVFITFNIPSNQIFRIIMVLFCFTFPVCLMAKSLENKYKLLEKVTNLLTILFIPFILAQIYALTVRIFENGITINRYFCIMLIIFEIVVVLFNFKRFIKYQNFIILVLSLLIIITTIIPYFNAINISYLSQLNIIKSFYIENISYDNLSKEEKNKVYEAYYYIKNTLRLADKLPEYIDKEKILGYEEENNYSHNIYQDNYKYLDYDDKNKMIDISNYQEMYYININEYMVKDLFKDMELKGFNIISDELENISIKKAIKKSIQEFMQQEKIINNVIEIDEKYTFYIKEIIMYYEEEGTIESIQIKGYLFTK